MPKLPVLKPRQVIAALERQAFVRCAKREAIFIQAGEFTCDYAKPPWGFESTCVEIHFTAVANEQ